MLSIALPHVGAWNTWFDSFGNTAEGFAELNARITAAACDAGREPGDILRSACMFVALDGGRGERGDAGATPVDGTAEQVAAAVRELGEAGADEVILVADPITEASIRRLAEVVALVQA
jgi:alkanesulfonate monooxygenase SsuD/methylene tetrahydromethanopterin reductase-like flavin-dependent oxidoreductase (luciferase family)